MSTKIVKIEVPLNWNIPDELNKLSPDENAFILYVGCETIKDARALIAGLSEKEIYNKIREESKDEIKKLERDLLVEKEIQSKMDSTIRNFYEKQMENMKKQLEEMRKQIIIYENQNKDIINSEVDKVELKLNSVIEEKDKVIERLSSTYQNLYTSIQSHKSTSHKGKEGEQLFEYYAEESFKDFKGFNLIDKHTQGGAGDFHIQFEDFDVLVDAKNYKKKVPIEQRDKIKKDLMKNEHIPFAWLVSLNTSIDKYDKSPVMYEWINTKQCIVYINNLTEYEDPRKILRVVWFTCKELYKFVEEINIDNEELQELKNDKFKLMDRIKNMRKTMREINTTLNTTRNMLQLIDEELKEILSSETEKLVESNYSMFDDWWETNIKVTNEDEKILSTDLWFKFKQDNKTSMKELDIKTEKFKQYIKAKVPLESIILKSKNANSAFEIKGIKWKIVEKEVEETLLVSDVEKKQTKRIKSQEVYFDEKRDKTIIEDYIISDDNIITIANRHNIKTFQLVSLLVKYKIITKSSESRGYEIYKETEEYKSKIEN
jgi:hypothetical protein